MFHRGLHALFAVLEEGENEGEDSGGEQDLDERVVELLEHELPQWRRLLLHATKLNARQSNARCGRRFGEFEALLWMGPAEDLHP